LLSDPDREALSGRGVALGPDLRERLARERYFGYIACTRSSERLVLTCADQDADGRKLNQSSFLSQLRRLFPDLEVEQFRSEAEWREAEHVCELIEPLVAAQRVVERWSPTRRVSNGSSHLAGSETGAPQEGSSALLQIPALAGLHESLSRLRSP